jgi:hypothetical protein
VSFDSDGMVLALSIWVVALGLFGFLALVANWPHHR